MVNNFIDLDTPPRSRVSKEKTEANDLRSRMMTPPVPPEPFEHHHEEPDDVPRTPGEWLPQILKVESPPGLTNFVLLNHGKFQKTQNDGPDPGPPQPSSSDSSSSASSCNSDLDRQVVRVAEGERQEEEEATEEGGG